MNDPKDCPKRMEFPIRFLEIYKDCTGAGEKQDQITRAIALLKAHESMCECGTMPGDGNAALWDLERSLAIHKDMHTAFQGTPKGEYHARSIREIEDALTILRNSMEAPKESREKSATEVTMTHPLFGTSQWDDYVKRNLDRIVGMQNTTYTSNPKTSNLTFYEALDAVKRGKAVVRKGSCGSEQFLNKTTAVIIADMIATDWSIVEER